MLLTLFGALLLIQAQQNSPRTIAIDESLAAKANLRLGDRVTAPKPGTPIDLQRFVDWSLLPSP